MSKKVDVPVIIVGGGATGCVLSLELARHGVRFLTIDKLPGPAATSKAITVHARTLELIQRVDSGLLERYLNRGIHNQGYVLHFVKQGQRSESRPGMDFTTLDCEFPFLLVHRQCETEQFIRQYTEENYQCFTQWNSALHDFHQDEDGVDVTIVKDGDLNNKETIRCQYLVGCDGGNSTVQRILNVSASNSDYQGTRFQNLDVHLYDFPDVDDFAHYCVGVNHFLMIVKLPGGFYRLLLSDKGEEFDDYRQPFQNIIDQHFDGVTLGEELWHSDWQSIVKLADQYRYNNVFLAGDCAHVHSTTGGQGLNCCIQDAFNLGWKLSMALKGQVNSSILDSYQSERRPIAEQVIWAASSLHDIFMNHGRSMEERMSEMEDSFFVDKVISHVAGLAYTYHNDKEEAPLIDMPGPKVGDRVPNAQLTPEESLYTLQQHCGFTLLIFLPQHSNHEKEISTQTLELKTLYPDVLKVSYLFETESIIEQYGQLDTIRYYLVRPDGYLAYRCLYENISSLKSYLQNLFQTE